MNLKRLFFSMVFLLSAIALSAPAGAQNVEYVDANGISIGYTERGSGKPLVLLHGGGLTSAMWTAQAELLSRQYRVIMPDTRGHEKTNNPTHEFHYTLLANDVIAFCEALGLEKPVLMGYSDGGIIAMTVGIIKPDLPGALVLGGSAPPDGQAALDAYFEGMKKFYYPVTKRTALTDADLDLMYESDPSSWDMAANMHAKPGDPQYWRTLMKDVWAAWNNPGDYAYTDEQLSAITCPVLVIAGDRDEFFPVANAASFYKRLLNSELAIIPGATHAVFRSHGTLFHENVSNFLDRNFK